MAQLGDQTRFEQGGWYDGYTRYPFFAERAAWINSLGVSGKIAIAGCGWGYLVDELRKLGRDAYGFDASTYCVGKFANIRPPETSRVAIANVLNNTQMTNFRRNTVGMTDAIKIPLMVTEDLLPALTDAEVTTALTQCRNNATRVVHIITCAAPSENDPLIVRPGDLDNRNPEFIWRTHQDWKNRIGNNETVMNAEGGAVL